MENRHLSKRVLKTCKVTWKRKNLECLPSLALISPYRQKISRTFFFEQEFKKRQIGIRPVSETKSCCPLEDQGDWLSCSALPSSFMLIWKKMIAINKYLDLNSTHGTNNYSFEFCKCYFFVKSEVLSDCGPRLCTGLNSNSFSVKIEFTDWEQTHRETPVFSSNARKN